MLNLHFFSKQKPLPLSPLTADAPTLFADAQALLAAGKRHFLLAGCVGRADIEKADVALAVVEARLGLEDGSARIIASIADSAQALQAIGPLDGSSARLDGLTWNPAALAEDLGAPLNSPVLAEARIRLVIAAAAAKIPAFDWADWVGAAPEDAALFGFAGYCAARRDGERA